MPIPAPTGLQDFKEGYIYPANQGTWDDLASTREITISANALATSTANIIVGNIGFGNITINNSTLTANSNVIVLTTTTSNIANISVGMRVYDGNIAANTTVTSIRNSTSGVLWDNIHSWITNPGTSFLWNSPLIDNGENITFNCLINCEAVGEVSYEIRSSSTGIFDGTETLRTVGPGNVDIAAHHGRFLSVTANVVSTGSMPKLSTMDVTVTNEKFNLFLDSVDTSTLTGSSSSRQLDLGRQASYIYNIQMTPHYSESGGDYVLDGYTDTGYFTNTLIRGSFPQIVDKSNGNANICVVDNDGNFIDSTLDISVTALPEQYYDNNNILQR